jgi:hypothetical protein
MACRWRESPSPSLCTEFQPLQRPPSAGPSGCRSRPARLGHPSLRGFTRRKGEILTDISDNKITRSEKHWQTVLKYEIVRTNASHRYHRNAMILIGQLEDRPGGYRTSSPRPSGSSACQRLTAVIVGLVAGWRIEWARIKHGKAVVPHLPEHRDDAIGPSRVVHAGEPAFHREGPHRESGRRLGGNLAPLDVLRAVRMGHIRQTRFLAMCH